MSEPAAERPLLRVVHGGDPTPDELAALVAVLAARRRARSGAAGSAAGGGWPDRSAGLRRALTYGLGGWRAVGRVPGTRTRAGV